MGERVDVASEALWYRSAKSSEEGGVGAVTYAIEDGVALVTMDDGKVNALSEAMLGEIDAALERARSDQLPVVLAGRPGLFCGGFDLKVMQQGRDAAVAMLRAGFGLSAKMLSFPLPVVVACTGHAIAMGVFLVLSGDYRIGARGSFKVVANEVAIGLTMPYAAIEICRHRLASSYVQRVVNNAETFTPDGAVEAGFLDRVEEPDAVVPAALEMAAALGALDRGAHAATKLRVREELLRGIEEGVASEFGG